MYPITLLDADHREHSFESFQAKFLDICKDHRENGRALAFAFILYDFQNAHVAKMLQDESFVRSLHHQSGTHLTIFYLQLARPRRRPRPQHDSRYIQMLQVVNFNDNPSNATNQLLTQYFGQQVEVSYPAVLFFQVHNNSIIDSLLVELTGKNADEVYNEISGYVAPAVEALKKITAPNVGNSQEIFNNLELRVGAKAQSEKRRRAFQKARETGELFSLIRGFFTV